MWEAANMFACLWNFFDWLDQPVTSSTPGMDNKKIVQSSTPPAVPVQVRSKHDGSGVAASVSGVRRRSGPQAGLRSPAAKRPLSAPVALQGWLYKQGSEGLMLWKKRWFVLSEYCLFYYKGPEEEKLLGSILLPSYRVTVCKSEDKVNKKFAFKAEHANMRTYHFAADSRESMNQWVNALTLATLLQDPSPGAGEAAVVIEIAQDGERSARPSVSSISSILNQSADDSDSGFHGFQSRDDPSHASNNNSSPNSANTASFPNLSGSNSNGNSANNNHASDSSHPMMNGWVQQSSPYGQPSTSQPQQQQHQHQQYGHLLPQQLTPGHSHQHQALLHHHLPHQNALPTHQSSHPHKVQQSPQQQPQPQQLSHPGSGGVQTMQPMPRTKFGQPIYANAPPKPRRLTDGSNEYSTPSPDMDYRKSPVSPDVTVTSKSPMSDYERSNTIYGTRIPPSQQSLRIDKSGLNYYGQTTQPMERRTPDTYGRSAKPRTSSRGNGDYEEVYGTPQLYQRPAGPVGYTKGVSPAPIPIPLYAQHLQQLHSPVTPPNMAMVRQSRTQPPPRPHSADFLEYEAARRPQQQPAQCERPPDQQRCPQRPKSSLDIMNPSDTTNDGYFYSEERYAAQMRQSAVYLHQTPQHYQQQRNQSLSRVTMQPKLPGIRDNTDESRIATLPDSTCPALRRTQRDHVHQQHTMPAQSLTQRHSEIMGADPKLRRSLREKSCEANGRETLTHGEDNTIPRRIPRGEYDGWGRAAAGHGAHGTHIAQTCHAGHAGASRRWSEQQQFCRSASARLPRTRHPAAFDPDDDDYAERSSEQDSRDGERKIQQREESMKRLLEWKQRMLQSPLTRKPSGSANRGRTQNDLSSYYKQQALLDLAAHEAAVAEGRHSRRREDGHRSHVRSKSSDGRRTAVNVPRYNSYSSDDEELGDVRRKRSRRPSHAGRSPRHAGDDRSSATSAVQDVTIPGTGRTSVNQIPQSQTVNARKANPGGALSSLGGIPPDAGYDEVSFPPMMRNDYAYASSSADRQSSSRRSDPEAIFEDPATRHKTPKKPSGILKTSTAYGLDQQKYDGQQTGKIESSRSDNLCVYRTNESWHVQKNVQWDSKDDNDEWDPGIDESKVIREFSYQYINPKKVPVPSKVDDEGEKFETMNLVQCRIRSFEMNMDGASPVKEVLTMQEPLKVSPLQATEAHVSKLDCANKTSSVIRSFALGDANSPENASKHKSVEEGHAKQASTDSNKSVKDLLADFERKSQQVNRPKRQESKHRGDYGDNETSRYEIASNLDRRDRDDEKEKLVEKNEAITQRFALDTLYTDTVQMQNSDGSLKQNKMTNSKESLTDQCVSSTDLNIIPSPNCARTSMTESLLTHSDQFSTNDLISSVLKQDDINSEDHYLPMSPRKAILDPNSDDRPNPKIMESLFASLQHEESSYVEMAQNGMNRSLLAPNEGGGKHDSGDYSTLDASHYELVCVSDNKIEPVYMEVNQLSEKEDEDGSKASSMKKSNVGENSPHSRGDLPDILTALKSDSSDADDESSKDLDSIDAPRHPRFSLSDTFRPASYYLGASRNMIAELHDSSDSELVSPPPIPTSPPPLDDLDSLDMQESLEIKKVSPQVAMTKDNAMNRDSPKSWNKPAGQVETHRPPSRFSDATISSTFRDSRISLESASGSDSIELRNPEEEARHRQLKRRPVSDDVCEVLDSLDELESLRSRFDASIFLDQYMEELQARDAFNVDLYAKDLSYNSIYGFNENMLVVDKLQKTTCQDLSRKMKLMSSNLDRPFDYSGKNKTGSASSLPSMRVSDLPPTHQHSQSFTGDAHYENVTSFSPLRGSPAVRPDSEPPRDSVHRMQSTSQLPISHSRDSSYSNASAAASISTSMACQRPASAQSSMHSPISASTSSVNYGSTLTSMLQNVNAYSDQRFPNHSRSASHDTCVRHVLPTHRSTSSQDSSHYPGSMPMQPVPQQSYLPNASEQRAQSDQSGAPYYYSDLQASVNSVDMELTKPMIGHTSRLPQLNNQRDDAAIGLNKRNDIGRIVNPIARQMPRQIQVDDIDEARRIAAELRRTTCQLLGDNKAALVDKRNFYEADTLRRVKSTDPLPDVSLPEARNLYPHGLRDKSVNPGNIDNAEPMHVTQASHRRSRSLEGLLDDVGLQNLVEQRNRANRAAAAAATATATTSSPSTSQVEATQQNLPSSGSHNAMTESNFNSEDPWEQDSLWCESLRRVSLRNARSLDNLDSPPRPGRSGDAKSRGRITRGATYVNDSVALRRDNCAEESPCGERPRVKRRTNKDHHTRERSIVDDEDVAYEALSMEVTGAGGYVWDPQSKTYHKPTVSDRNHFLEDGNLPPARSIPDVRMSATSFELDREKLRQWDLLSSACLLQEQQRTSMADSGRGLPVVEHPGDAHDSRLAVVAAAAATTTMNATTTTVTTTATPTTMTTTTTTTTITTMGTINSEQVDVIVKPVDIADVRDVLPTKVPIKRQEPRQEPCKRAAASGSGSVIGRDPLPPRAVSTSHLPQRTLTQPPTAVSTLPLPRNSTGGSHRQQPLPLHHSTPQQQQQQQQPPMRQLENESTAQMLRAASNGDIGKCPGMVTGNDMRDLRLASPGGHSTQRLISPIGHLRVASLNDHRVSSPSDSEIRVHSPSERKMISPIGREVDRGGGTTTMTGQRQQQQRSRADCSELLHKRSNVSSLRADAGGRLVAQAGASGLVRVSAGELLGRTHEELVLLLIQLRRQNATVLKAMETCHMEIEAQARLADLDTPRRLENLQKLEELKRHLMDLEKQYEKSKPLVNLVDNMVKLGSLYNRNTANGTSNVSGSRHDLMHENARDHRDRLEFNQRVQEQRLLAEERRDWDRLSPDHGQLQAKVQQLYKLDRLLQEESGTLHSLQQDKEILEKALGGLRHKLQGSRSNLAEAERYRKQQLLLERELSRVRILLAHNSKKLEETVAENARLEQDLVVLRQKVQASRRYAGNIARDTSSTTAPLEAELRRVQQLVGDLQRQRKELSIQVRQLTEKSHSLVQQIRPQPPHAPQVHHSKKRTQNSWLETDLDSGITLDHGLDSPSSTSLSISPPNRQNDSSHQRYGSPTQYKDLSPLNRPHNQQSVVQPSQNHISALSPQLREQIQQHQLKQQLLKDQMQGKGSAIQVAPLYVNTDSRAAGDYVADTSKHNGNVLNGAPNPAPEYIPPPPPPLSEEALLLNDNYRQNEDNKFAGLMHSREKQEIKTVRIVKRESERRQRDRGDRTGNLGIPLTNGLQAPGGAKRLCDDDLGGSQKFEKAQLGRVVEESPIVHAQSTVQLSELDDVQFQRSMSLPRGFGGQKQHSGIPYGPVVPPPRSDSMHALKSMMARRHKIRGMGRARDDLDMERALRPRINAPDVVRSTLSHKELKYNESTIDQLLGTPNKIVIPERYIPEQTPELTAEEQEQRLKKAEAIRKMLSETTVTAPEGGDDDSNVEKSDTLKRKVVEEKRQREHILQLNQILAKQVMEKSKMVAVKALATLPLKTESSLDDEDLSPVAPLPLYQQRENFYS